MSNTRHHKDSDNPNANITLKPDPYPNPTYPNKPTEPYQTVLTLTDTVGLQCAPRDWHTSQDVPVPGRDSNSKPQEKQVNVIPVSHGSSWWMCSTVM